MEGKILGDYLIVKNLGQDPLGSLFLAEHRFLKKSFSLKVLPQECTSFPHFVDRFEKEMPSLVHLSHPNIVSLHNVSHVDGSYFLVMDDIGPSMTLLQYLKERKDPLDEAEVFHLVNQIASVLDYLHSKKYVHGFLKLSNIFINAEKKIYVSDIGLIKILGEEVVLKQSHKLPLSFLEHFSFLSPEQRRKQSATFLSDIYAFGVLTYFLIVRHFPEGFFETVAEMAPSYRYNWDALLKKCLSCREEKREKELLPLLEEMKSSIAFKQAAPRIVEENIREEISTPVFAKVEAESLVTVGAEPIGFPSIPPASENPIYQMLNREPVVTEYHPEKRATQNIEPILCDTVEIPSGKYMRGSNTGNRDESPRHEIYVKSFRIDVHPVTNEQFLPFLEWRGGEKDENYHDLIRLKDSRINRAAGQISIESGYSKHPVVGVTWYGAFSYAKWVGKRLPTEAEWEIAASGGLDTLYPTGDIIEKSQANFFSSDTTRVKSYAPNNYGLYDIAGNVYEWCQDWYNYSYYEVSAVEPNNPKGPHQGVYRVLRGGCWKSLKDDLRVTHRHRNNPGAMNGTYGFRCAQDC